MNDARSRLPDLLEDAGGEETVLSESANCRRRGRKRSRDHDHRAVADRSLRPGHPLRQIDALQGRPTAAARRPAGDPVTGGELTIQLRRRQTQVRVSGADNRDCVRCQRGLSVCRRTLSPAEAKGMQSQQGRLVRSAKAREHTQGPPQLHARMDASEGPATTSLTTAVITVAAMIAAGAAHDRLVTRRRYEAQANARAVVSSLWR